MKLGKDVEPGDLHNMIAQENVIILQDDDYFAWIRTMWIIQIGMIPQGLVHANMKIEFIC